MDVARRDYMEYFVDKILQHRGNPKKSSSMEFEVSWLNYFPPSIHVMDYTDVNSYTVPMYYCQEDNSPSWPQIP